MKRKGRLKGCLKGCLLYGFLMCLPFLSIAVCVFVYALVDYIHYNHNRQFDIAAEGIVLVETDGNAYGDEPEIHYFAIAKGKPNMECDPFEPADMLAYDVPTAWFDSYIDRSGTRNRIVNRLLVEDVTSWTRDEPCPFPEVMNEINPMIAEIDHDIMYIRVFSVDGEYFVYLELNVNWWTPCELYWYDRQDNELIELHTFDHERVLSIRLLSRERLYALS